MPDFESPLSPLTPPNCDLRDFSFIPLDVVRLRDSDLAAKVDGEAFRCAVLLWCAAWHQLLAASLPDDDDVLAQLAGFGRVKREWMRHREGALRGWLKCNDRSPIPPCRGREGERGVVRQSRAAMEDGVRKSQKAQPAARDKSCCP